MTDLKISDLTDDEFKALEAMGRIQGDTVLPAPQVKSSLPELPADQIPVPTPEISQRIAAAKKLESSFVQEDARDGVVRASKDGGAAAKAVPDVAVNPDFAGKAKEDPIESADKERFLAMMLGADRFKKSYTLFGGNLVVTFRTRSAAEENECAEQAFRDERRDGLGHLTADEARHTRLTRFQNYQFAAALESIGKPRDLPRKYEAYNHPKAKPGELLGAIKLSYDDLITEMPAPLLAALRMQHQRFEILVGKMTLAAEQPDFW